MRFKDAQKMLTDAGYQLDRVNGSHYAYKKPATETEQGCTFTIPYPSGGSKDLHWKLVKKLKQACKGIRFINGRRQAYEG